MGVAGIST